MAGLFKATSDVLGSVGDVASAFSDGAKLLKANMAASLEIADALNAKKVAYVKANADTLAANWFEEKYGIKPTIEVK